MFGKHALRSPEHVMKAIMSGRLVRAIVPDSAPVRVFIDGAEVTACAGESVLVAVLAPSIPAIVGPPVMKVRRARAP